MECKCITTEFVTTLFKSMSFQTKWKQYENNDLALNSKIFQHHIRTKIVLTQRISLNQHMKTLALAGYLYINKLFCCPCLLLSTKKLIVLYWTPDKTKNKPLHQMVKYVMNYVLWCQKLINSHYWFSQYWHQ